MVHARPGRVREFSAGRFAARAAMLALGLPPLPIPMGPDRAPCWPAGLIGSITHSASLCLAAVGRVGTVSAIGLDIEDDSPLPANLWPVICDDAERGWIARQPEPARGRSAKALFCAKEAAYKAQYALSYRLIDFAALHVRPDPERGTFTARFTKAVPPFFRPQHLARPSGAGRGPCSGNDHPSRSGVKPAKRAATRATACATA